MSTTLAHSSQVIPAHLSFLAIYNPSLGTTDESVREQIVFYSSAVTRARRNRKNEPEDTTDAEREEENEQLRQVGLAQGMVDFAKWVGQIVSLSGLPYTSADAVSAISLMESRLTL